MSADIVSFPSVCDLSELPDLSQVTCRKRVAYLIVKRALDIVIGGALLVAASPLLALAAVLIRLDSKGPAIFVQERVGARYVKKQGRIVWQLYFFRCYKLRTMRRDSDPAVHKEYLARFCSGYTDPGPKVAPFKLARDLRITRVGRWLRKTSLDELPQLVNVIRGEMSLVGPRPVPVYEVELYDERHFNRLAAKPGITGLWQVYGRSRVTFEEMVQMDVEYAQRSSLWCDCKLLLLTIRSVVSQKGAA